VNQRKRVPREESVFRAITEANSDGVRIYSGAFRTTAEISLCRAKVLPLKKIVSIFHRDVRESIVLIAELTVAFIEDSGANFKKGQANKLVAAPFPLTVVADPERCNRSHAVIPQLHMPERLAKQLAETAIKHPAGKRRTWHVIHRRVRLAVDWVLKSTRG
jgi:hypothetical protein